MPYDGNLIKVLFLLTHATSALFNKERLRSQKYQRAYQSGPVVAMDTPGIYTP